MECIICGNYSNIWRLISKFESFPRRSGFLLLVKGCPLLINFLGKGTQSVHILLVGQEMVVYAFGCFEFFLRLGVVVLVWGSVVNMNKLASFYEAMLFEVLIRLFLNTLFRVTISSSGILFWDKNTIKLDFILIYILIWCWSKFINF